MKLMQKKHIVYCLIGIPLLAFTLFILSDYLLPEDSTFLGWSRFIVWIFRLVLSVGSIIYAYISYRRLENKYNLFLLPLCIFLSCIASGLMVNFTVGYSALSWLWYAETLFFSVPVFVLTFIIAIPFEIEKFFKRK